MQKANRNILEESYACGMWSHCGSLAVCECAVAKRIGSSKRGESSEGSEGEFDLRYEITEAFARVFYRCPREGKGKPANNKSV